LGWGGPLARGEFWGYIDWNCWGYNEGNFLGVALRGIVGVAMMGNCWGCGDGIVALQKKGIVVAVVRGIV